MLFQDRRRPVRGPSGQIIVGAIVALLIIAIFTPLIVHYVRQEGRWASKQKRTTNAFHLAEAGVDRGIWKLTETDDHWNDAKGGTPIAGYNDDVEYEDVEGGKYKIKFSSGPDSGEVTIRAKGRDNTTQEMRAIEAVYTKASIDAGLQVEGGMDYRPNMKIHWGPVVNYTSINQSPSDYYPRKYSKGQIVGRDTVDNSNNTDDKEYWAFDDDLGDPPQVDLDYYKTVAKASRVPVDDGVGQITRNAGGSTLAVATPTGSGYFRTVDNGNVGLKFDDKSGNNPPNAYYFRNSTSVIYIDGAAGQETVMSSKCFLQLNALIIAGHDLDCNADDFDNFGATIPASAPLEYQHASAAGTWTSNFAAVGAGNCCYDIDNMAAHGFIYVGGDMSNAGGGTVFVGVVDVIGTITMNTVTIYYDSDVASGIRLKAGTPRRVSWREVKTTW